MPENCVLKGGLRPTRARVHSHFPVSRAVDVQTWFGSLDVVMMENQEGTVWQQQVVTEESQEAGTQQTQYLQQLHTMDATQTQQYTTSDGSTIAVSFAQAVTYEQAQQAVESQVTDAQAAQGQATVTAVSVSDISDEGGEEAREAKSQQQTITLAVADGQVQQVEQQQQTIAIAVDASMTAAQVQHVAQPQQQTMEVAIDASMAAGDLGGQQVAVQGMKDEIDEEAMDTTPFADEPEDLWCEDCNSVDGVECKKHGPMQRIPSKPVLSKARASLPNQLFLAKSGETTEHGVFTKRALPKRTQFGPVEAKLLHKEEIPEGTFLLKLQHKTEGDEQPADQPELYYDLTNEDECNWMMFVKPAANHMEQNLVAYQHGNEIFYTTIKSVEPRQELKVWYSTTYASFMGASVHEITEEEKEAMREREATWPCFECPRKFMSSEQLQRHLAVHEKVITVRRRRWGKGRRGRRRKVPAGDRDNLECDVCHKVFLRAYSLQRHQVMHSGEKKFNCPVCKKMFSHDYNRTRHLRKHQDRGEGLEVVNQLLEGKSPSEGTSEARDEQEEREWSCQHCVLVFESAELLRLHVRSHPAEELDEDELESEDDWDSDDDEDDNDENTVKTGANDDQDVSSEQLRESALGKNFLCDVCNKSLGSKQALKYHMRRHEERGEADIQCPDPDCDKTFQQKRDLVTHSTVHGKVKSAHGMVTRRALSLYKCDQCGKAFRDSDKLDKHLLLHVNEEDRPIVCEVCNKRFLNNSAIACHRKTHSGKKYYACPFCNEGFDRTETLREHVPVHAVDGVYSCPTCSKTFPEFVQVRKHIRSFHSDKMYQCQVCEKAFPRPDKLKLHMLKHSDRRDFLCANCGKQFKRKDKLKEHMLRMHNPEREARNANRPNKPKAFKPKTPPSDYNSFTFKCRGCMLGFRRRGMLVNHLAKRHPETRPESIPELALPIIKPNRDYFCQYCEKVYKSSSKRKAHILKNHPGAELPPSIRKLRRNPQDISINTHTGTAGTIASAPVCCPHCPKQYSSKAKMTQHIRKKHAELVGTAIPMPAPTVPIPPAAQQAIAEAAAADLTYKVIVRYDAPPNEPSEEAVLEHIPQHMVVQAPQQDANVARQTVQRFTVETTGQAIPVPSETMQAADLLTQAMSELSQTLSEYRPQPAEYQTIAAHRVVTTQPTGELVHHQVVPVSIQTADQSQGTVTVDAVQTVVSTTEQVAVTHPIAVSTQAQPQQFIARPWPGTFTGNVTYQ
ncbi:PR domain zinc finger protein 10 [Branchiostoma belcheri]|nr:PR domain zinc finger protein 10 [Branchiostoma belcheri]